MRPAREGGLAGQGADFEADVAAEMGASGASGAPARSEASLGYASLRAPLAGLRGFARLRLAARSACAQSPASDGTSKRSE